MGEGFPLWSMASMAAEGQEPFRYWICLSVSLCLCVSDSGLSPFLISPKIRNSNWAEIWTRFLFGYWLSCCERRAPTALCGGHEGPGHAPYLCPPWASSRVDSSSQKSHIFQKISVSFYPVWTPFDMDFLRNNKPCNKQEVALGIG
mgnify:CR=1 FL=1